MSLLAFSWTADRIAALVIGAAFLLFLRVYFFGGRRREGRAVARPADAAASEAGGAAPGEQEATIVVSGAYDPEVVIAKKGIPLTLVFDRRESSPCSDEVVIPEFGIRQALAPNARTRIRIVPLRAGEFPFACGMNMLHGLLRVEDAAP
jgi:Cu+-exporting ATPase